MNRIKELRKENSLTQSELGKILNVSDRSVGFYETGERDPDTDTLKKLADYFNVSIDFLLGRTDIRTPITTVALHRTDSYDDDLPEEAKKEIENFKEYVKQKYKIDPTKD